MYIAMNLGRINLVGVSGDVLGVFGGGVCIV